MALVDLTDTEPLVDLTNLLAANGVKAPTVVELDLTDLHDCADHLPAVLALANWWSVTFDGVDVTMCAEFQGITLRVATHPELTIGVGPDGQPKALERREVVARCVEAGRF